MGNLIKINFQGESFFGYKHLPLWVKLKYRQAVKFICQDCHEHEEKVGKLEIHRVKRGVENGLYTLLPLNHPFNNCKVLCKNCHQKYNYSRRLVYK